MNESIKKSDIISLIVSYYGISEKDIYTILEIPETQPNLRDQFAMAALSAVIYSEGVNGSRIENVEIAYDYADEMLEMRCKQIS